MRRDHWRIEALYLPDDLDDLAELRRRVIEAGHSASVANGLVGWLLSKTAGETDVSESRTRSKYRKILAELGYRPDDADVETPLQLVASDGSTTRSRRVPGGRTLGAVIVALSVLTGGAAATRGATPAQARTAPQSAQSRADDGSLDRTWILGG